jgi:hypothetical protein
MLSVFLFITFFCAACWFITPTSAPQVNSGSQLTDAAIATQPVVNHSPTPPITAVMANKSPRSTTIVTTAKLSKDQNIDPVSLDKLPDWKLLNTQTLRAECRNYRIQWRNAHGLNRHLKKQEMVNALQAATAQPLASSQVSIAAHQARYSQRSVA